MNSCNYKYTIIFLHGMYQDNKSLDNLVKDIINYNNLIKVILPNAPIRTITWPNKPENNVNSWYNYFTRQDGTMEHDEINIKQFNKQTDKINEMIENEIKILGDSRKIIIGGVSQGGTLALNIALTSKYKLGGYIGIHTILMNNVISLTNKMNKLPIFLFSGEKDQIYNIKLQKYSFKELYKFGYEINWEIEDLTHCQYSEKENKFIINAINTIIL